MNKQQFLMAIRDRLNGLPQSEIEKYLDYYSEMIDDRIEDGLSEEEAVSSMESVEDIASQILLETPLPKLVKAKVNPGRSLKAWEIVLLILGFPLWFPLLAAAGAVILSVYIVLWSVVLVLYAVDLVFAAAAVSCIASGIATLFSGVLSYAVLVLGSGLICAGIAILLFFVFNKVTMGIVVLGKIFIRWIKSLFIKGGKDNEQS